MTCSTHLTLKYQELLRNLKTTVEGLVNSQVANVWQIYGGLNRLHVDVDKIFRHNNKSTPDGDYWQFIQGLEWLQPDTSSSTFVIDCEYKPHLPQNLKNDKSSTWLYRSLENHSLSLKLSWLLSDKSNLLSCYTPDAFLCQEDYAEAVMICLRAVERNQPSLLSEIKPSLFLLNNHMTEFRKSHRRCSSFPDSHLKNIKIGGCRSFDSTFKINEIKKVEKSSKTKLRTWNSTPNLFNVKSPSNNFYSRTTPNTPNRSGSEKLSPSIFKVDYTGLQGSVEKEKESATFISSLKGKSIKGGKVKSKRHVIINNTNIIEHTPPLSSSQGSTLGREESKSSHTNASIKLGSSLPEYSFLSSISGIAGEKDFQRKPKKSFIEDGGMSVLPMATGYFPRPKKGQTLTSFLLSSQFTRANAELDRENAHFSISEAVISAMEQLKCRRDLSDHQDESDEEIINLKQRIRLRRRQKIAEKQKRTFGSPILSDSTATELSSISSSPGSFSASMSSDDVDDLEIDEASNLNDNRGLSMSMASLYSDADVLKRPRGAPDGASDILSAEGVALSLISKFNEKQLPKASDLEWLVSEEDAPQALLPLPKSWPVNPDEHDTNLTPLRGTREWAPPRPQIIFTIHPVLSRKDLMEKQNYKCAGCGMRVAEQYASKFRYCNYLGRYFCTGCHTNQLAIIPARVLQKWNFSRLPVANFSYRLLEQMYADPLFRIFEVNKNAAKLSKNLKICRKFRLGLFYLKDFILTCRFAETIQDYFNNEPSYIFNDPEMYSMEDLVKIKSGELKIRLRCIIEMCCRHTSECQLCLARGFICEECRSAEVLFPWQMSTVTRCKSCGSCFHIKCWDSKKKPCIRCNRYKQRRESACSSH